MDTIEIPKGHMPFYWKHPTHGYILLGTAPQQPKTKLLCLSILNRYPAVSKVEWKWTKGEGLRSGKWKAYFFTPGEDDPQSIHADYPGTAPRLDLSSLVAAGHTITVNDTKKGIEVRFDRIPTAEATDILKLHGFRWSGKVKVWYAFQNNEQAMALMAQLWEAV